MKADFDELNKVKDAIIKSVMTSIQSYLATKENETPIFSYGVYHYRLFTENCDFVFYQWKTERCLNFSVGSYIESSFGGKSSEGRWLIKSISYNIEPNEDIMIDIIVEFEPY